MAAVVISGGGFQDSEGNPLAGGTLRLTLNRDAYTDSTYTSLVCAGEALEYALDDNGNISGTPSAWPNDQILDVWNLIADTYYMAQAESADGQLAWGPNALYILSSPTPFVLSAVAPINPA